MENEETRKIGKLTEEQIEQIENEVREYEVKYSEFNGKNKLNKKLKTNVRKTLEENDLSEIEVDEDFDIIHDISTAMYIMFLSSVEDFNSSIINGEYDEKIETFDGCNPFSQKDPLTELYIVRDII